MDLIPSYHIWEKINGHEIVCILKVELRKCIEIFPIENQKFKVTIKICHRMS